MFLHDVVRRRLASLLQPWMVHEPELELELGLINSRLTAKNLKLNDSVLSRLVDESSRFSIEEISVELVSFRFSNWLAPAFKIEVHGLNIVLSAREVRRVKKSNEEKKKALADIDPEGSALHKVLKRILDTTDSRSCFTNSLLNLVLRHCHLEMFNSNLKVLIPVLNGDVIEYFLELKEVNAESQYYEHGCIHRGFIGAMFKPLKEASFAMDFRGFGFRYKMKDQMNQIFSSVNLFTGIKLVDLQLADFRIHSPEISVLLTPLDLSVLSASSKLLSRELTIHVRNGRQLWRLAAKKLGYPISSPRLSLMNLVEFVCLWLRYLNAYEHLLSVIGCNAKYLTKESASKISQEKNLKKSIKYKWEMISSIEKELPVDAIAQARRIARYRATFNIQHGEDTHEESSANGNFKFFTKIFPILALMVNVVCGVLRSIVNCFFLIESFFQQAKLDGHLGNFSEDYYPQYYFLLNVGNISITISPTNMVQNIDENMGLHFGISYSDMLSFNLSTDALLLVYIDDIFEQSLSISCEPLQVKQSSVRGDRIMESSSENPHSSVRGHQKRKNHDLSTVLQGEPAPIVLPSQTSDADGAGENEGVCSPLLTKFLGEMWLTWKRTCMKYDDNEIEYSENPWLLCELKTSLLGLGLNGPYPGYWKCSLTVGKINLALDYTSILSITMLLGQIQHTINWTDSKGRASVLSHFPPTSEDQLEVNWERKYEFYESRMKMAVLSMLPEKCIQLAVFITGPHIEMSLKKVGFGGGNNDMNHLVGWDKFQLRFDIHNIEATILSPSESDSTLTGLAGDSDAETECPNSQEPKIIEISKSYNKKCAAQWWTSLNSHLRVNGMVIYIGDSAERQQNQNFVLKPLTVQFSLVRESVHSFNTTVNAFSAALCGIASGFSIMSYKDELYVLLQVVAGLFPAIFYAFSNFNRNGFVPHEDFVRQNVVFTEFENDENSLEEAPLIHFSILFSFNGTFKFKPMDIVLQKPEVNDKRETSITMYNFLNNEKLAEGDLSDVGIWISVHETCVEVSCEEGKLEILLDLLGIRFIIFRHKDLMGENFYHSVVRNLQQQYYCWLYEISLSNCTFALRLDQSHNSLNNTLGNNDSTGNTLYTGDDSYLVTESQRPSSSTSVQKLSTFSNAGAPPAGHWIMINVSVGEIFVARCSVKNLLVKAHQLNKLRSLLSVGRSLQAISWEMQGGLLFFESRAWMVFVHCFDSYLHCIENLLSIAKSSNVRVENAEYQAQLMTQTSEQLTWKHPEDLTIDFSQFSVVLVVEDDYGSVQEIVMEADFFAKLKSEDMLMKFIFDLNRVSIFSQVLKEIVENKNQMPHFFSHTSNASSSGFLFGDCAVTFQHGDGSMINNRNQMLNHLAAVITIEKPKNGPLPLNQIWVGNGSVSGFDITISLSEIQMISSIISSFSAASHLETESDLKQKHVSNNHETDNSLENVVPDGSIVSIQDVNQHMYFAVEGRENKYSLVGVIHYSLAGEKALFRVKHHKQRIWRSSVLWFSLISLHAKNDFNEPLRLTYRPGSGFVDISSTNDNKWSLWRALSHEPEIYKGDIDWEPYNKLVKDTFYLVNKKNDCAVAFVDGIPEFVAKPGNPFKFKVFHDVALPREVTRSNGHSLEASGAINYHNAHVDERQTSMQSGSLPRIHIQIDSVNLTIVDELSDTKDRFLLLRGCINNTQLDVQRLAHKTRVMSKSSTLLYYFDAQRDSWRELVHPVEICIFYRSNFQIQGSEIDQHGMPVHIYCRTKGFDISLTELSLDILLFVTGKLNLAGPFAVRSSMILANCCKVENRSGLNLLCHFYNEKSVTIAGKQSASVFLRQAMSVNKPLESVPVVTIQLSTVGSLATSTLQFSSLKPQTLAWRTRIMSLQDSGNYPGPFVVVDISRESEDCLSIVVSPLTRIHNETEFSMELRFRRPQQDENTFASVFLKRGGSIDDSMATFDAISMSGGLKKALMSLSVGNFLFSFRPEITDGLISSDPLSVEWSDDLKGGKAIRLSGIFDKLGYEVRRALSVESVKCSFSTACCTLKSGDRHVANLHFLIQNIVRDVPITQPDKSSDGSGSVNSAVALREQREIFLLPTMRVSNLLHLEIHVLLDETDQYATASSDNIGKQATIPCRSTMDFYVNPSIIYFTVTLHAFSSRSKPVNSGDWVKKLLKNRNAVRSLDIDLDFGGKYFATLRLSRGFRGILEAAIFTPYSLKNDTDFSLLLSTPNQKPPSRDGVRKFGSGFPPELGLFLPPNSIRSWLLKSHKMRLTLFEDHASDALLDLEALSGLTEISLETEGGSQVKYITKFGVSIGPSLNRVIVPSQTVTVVPRHVVFNESDDSITVRQCYLEDEMEGMIVDCKQRTTLKLQKEISRIKEFSVFENIVKKHRNDIDTSLVHIQFRLNEPGSAWSGPVCIASLGRFFLKFRKQSNQGQVTDTNTAEFAAVHLVEEGSTLGLHFYKPPNIDLPYRIENHLHGTSVAYHQKDSSEQEVLGADCSAYYVWEDLTLPHKLVVLINDMHLLHEIKLDKVRAWKPFLKMTQHRGLASLSIVERKSMDQRTHFGQLNGMEIGKLGYEVYAEGPTRVLRICEFSDSHKRGRLVQSCAKIQLRVSYFAVHLLEHVKQEINKNEESSHTPIIIAKLGNINLDSVFTEEQKFNVISVQSLNVDLKWMGAPFAAMLRRHEVDLSDLNTSTLKLVFVLLSTGSSVRQLI